MLVKQLGSPGHTGCSGHIVCTRAHILLLPTAVEQGMDLHLVPHIQDTDSLWPMDLMATDAHKVNPHFPGIYPCLAKSLYSIYMKQGTGIEPFDQSAHLCNGLQGPHLIVGVHDGHQNGIRANGPLQVIQGNLSVCIDWQIGNTISLCLQIFACLENGRMLHLGGNDMASPPVVGTGSANQCHIVRFCSSRGKKNFFILDLQ